MSKITLIDRKESFIAKALYGRLNSLLDLKETIKYYPEKQNMFMQIETEINDTMKKVDEWWMKISKITDKKYSNNAQIRFDISSIIDSN